MIGQAARSFDYVARLIVIAVVRLIFVANGRIDTFPTLVPAGGIKMAASATGTKAGRTIRAFVVPEHFAG